jgi:predicted glycoside hydrolase/deacetylase ChbG (UPF0249 family)
MLIITADDFGFSPSRNEAILAAAYRGRLSATSVLVNMPYAEEACQQVQQHARELGIGLHFNLTSGACVAPADSIPLLVDNLGMFCNNFIKLWRFAAMPEFREQIAIEFNAQHEKMLKIGRMFNLRIDHLDSHQHIHAIPAIREIIEPTAAKQKVLLRVPRELLGNELSLVGMLKRAILNHCIKGVKSRVSYIGVMYSGSIGQQQWTKIIMRISKDKSQIYEVNVHPGMYMGHESDGEAVLCSQADRNFHRSKWRIQEFNALLDTEFADTLRKEHLFPLAKFSDVKD